MPKNGESKLVEMEASLIAANDAREMAEKEVESLKATVKALEERVKRSETEVVELKNDTESRLKILESLLPKVDFLEAEVQKERYFSRKMGAKCQELEGEISRLLQNQNQYPKQKLKRAAPLPMELIIKILSWLPANSLIRCQSVCKDWWSLISSTQFKLMHLHNSNQLNPRSIFRHVDSKDKKQVCSVHFDDEALTVDHNIPNEFTNDMFGIVGCCNGVVCFTYMFSDGVALWNPSIRRKLGPLFGNCGRSTDSIVGFSFRFGFGYDRMSDDYKVVELAYNGDHLFPRPLVEVYSVKTNLWRPISFPHDFPCFYIVEEWSQVFFNGFVHWIAHDEVDLLSVAFPRYSIMTFDISNEVFGEIQLPQSLPKECWMNLMVGVVKESLAVIYTDRRKPWSDSWGYKIWAMKDYRNPTSWTVICNMHAPFSGLRKALRFQNKAKAKKSRYGDLMIRDHDLSFFEYYENVGDLGNLYYIDKYQESLALLDVGCSL